MHALSLEYHDVADETDFDVSGFPGAASASYKLTLTRFERHLDAIERRAAAPARATDWLSQGPRGRPVFVTFDDGGRSAHTCIAGALERRGWRGHFFVTAGRIGTPTFLTAGQIRELHDRGHVIGAHSFTHPARLGACPAAQILDEWLRSCGALADILGTPILTASVPGGFYTRRVAETAARAGIKVLFTSSPTTRGSVVDGCLVLGRYTLRRWSSDRTAGGLAGGQWGPRVFQWTLYNGLHLLRTIGGDRYTAWRQRFWARTT